MRCVLRPIVVRYAWLIVVMLTVAPTASAQSLVCQAIRRGESAAQAARRLTGDARNTYQASFQIMNPSSRFIPKSQYSRIRAGWRACVVKPAIDQTSANARDIAEPALIASNVSAAPAPPELAASTALALADTSKAPESVPLSGSAASEFLRAIWTVDLMLLWLGGAMVVPWIGWRILDQHLVRRKTASIVIAHFAHRFVEEFERPLIHDEAAGPALRSRIRTSVRRRRLDILLAPGKGRRYPNLSDHKKNVEYDVARVKQTLADDSFVSGPLYMQAGWVVVPFEFVVRRSRSEGGKAGKHTR